MLTTKVQNALNNQISLEQFSSQLYLAMASWAETNGYIGSAQFLYIHSDEERGHMLRLFHYVNDRGGHAPVPASDAPKQNYKSITAVFKEILEHEEMISASINELVGTCIDERDFTTQNFLQWYISEQIEEESTFRNILDKINLLGNDKAKMYIFDNDMQAMASKSAAMQTAE